MIKWVDELLAEWSGWMRGASRDAIGYQESILGRLARNPIVDHNAKRYGLPVGWTEVDDRMLKVSRAVSELPKQQRTVVYLRYVHVTRDVGWPSIGRIMRIDERTARRWLEDAHAALAGKFDRKAA